MTRHTRRSPTSRSTCTATTATRTTRTTSTRTSAGSPGSPAVAASAATPPRASTATRTRTGCARATPFDPILVAGGGLEWDEPPDNVNNASDPNDGVSEATDFMHNSGRPTDGYVKASGVKTGNVLIGTEEDFTTPCRESGRIVAVDITDSLGRRAGPELDADEAVPHECAGQLPSVPRHAGDDRPLERVLGALLRDPPVDAGGRVVHPGPAPGRRQQRPRLRQVGYYRVTGTGTDNPSSNSWDVAWYDEDPPKGKSSRKGKKRGASPRTRQGRLRLPDGHVARHRGHPAQGRRRARPPA